MFLGANLLLLELSCFRNIVLPYFENDLSPSEMTHLVFCSLQYKKTKTKGAVVHCSLFPKPVFGNLPQSKQYFFARSNFSHYVRGSEWGLLLRRSDKVKVFFRGMSKISFLL